MINLPDELRKELEEHCTHYAARRVALIHVMQEVQKFNGGWLSDEALATAAEIVGVDVADAEGVATFYNWFFREPVGKRVIVVCDSISCHLGGCDGVVDHISKRLKIGMGDTTADGEYTLLPVVCLGNCDKAPCLMVGDDLISSATPEILDGYFDAKRPNAATNAGGR